MPPFCQNFSISKSIPGQTSSSHAKMENNQHLINAVSTNVRVTDLNDAVDGNAANNKSSSTQVKPFRLLDLPAELRNRIYELVCYHEENNGCIAPVLMHHQSYFGSLGHDEFVGVIHGERQKMKYVCPDRSINKGLESIDERITTAVEDHFASGGGPDAAVVRLTEEDDGQAATYTCGHLCSRACLKQPAITKVNRQLREETLYIFYGVNKFHLEISNDSRNIHNTNMTRSLVAWWREIGDSNLRCLNNIILLHRDSLPGNASSGRTPGFILHFRKDQEKMKFRLNSKSKTYTLASDNNIIVKDDTVYSGNTVEHLELGKCVEYIVQIEDDGLFVRGLEKILNSLPGVFRPILAEGGYELKDMEEIMASVRALAGRSNL